MSEIDSTTKKLCGKCGKTKFTSAFSCNKNRQDGLSWDCKECNRNRSAERFKLKKAEYNARNLQNYQDNRERYIVNAAKWAAKNKEKRREISRKYVATNPEKRAETSRRNREQNPGLYAAHYKARQQRKRNAMPSWADEESIKAIYRQCAFVSSFTGVKHHVDHYYPLKSDVVCGLHNEYNLRIVPAAVNLAKGNKIPE